VSQHHSTALPYPKRYDNRYEGKVLKILTRTTNHEAMVVARRMRRQGRRFSH
jgi:hypothetical protein